MPIVRTRSRRVKDPADLENGALQASETNNSDTVSMKSTSDSGVDLCQDEKTSSKAAKRQPLKRKQQQQPQQQEAGGTESKKRRVNKKSSVQQPSVSETVSKKEPRSSRRNSKVPLVSTADEQAPETRHRPGRSTKTRTLTESAAQEQKESQKRKENFSRAKIGKDVAPVAKKSKFPHDRRGGSSVGLAKRTSGPHSSSREEKPHEGSLAKQESSISTGRPRRASGAPRASTIVKTKIPKGDSDEESDVESETDFSDNDDEDFVLPKSDPSDDEIPEEASDDDIAPGAVSEDEMDGSQDRKTSTAGGRVKKIKAFLNDIEQPSFIKNKISVDPSASSAEVKVSIPVSKHFKPISQRSSTAGRSSKAKSRDDNEMDVAVREPGTSGAKSAPEKTKRSLSSSDESDVAPKKAKAVKKVKTASSGAPKKTFMKPRTAPKPRTREDRSGLESSKFEMSLLKLAKQMDDSDDSDDETQDSSQTSLEVKTEEKPVEAVKQESVNDADKKHLIMSMLKEHEEVDEMSDDSSDEDAAAEKVSAVKIKSEVHTAQAAKAAATKSESVREKGINESAESPVKEKVKRGKMVENKSKKSAEKAEKKRKSKKKGAADSVKEEEESSGSDDDNWEVVEDRDPNYQRPENVTVVLQNEDFLPETKRLSMEQRMIRIINRKRKTSYLLCHRVHLMALVGHHRILNSIVNDDHVKAYAQSRLPASIALSGKRQKDTQIVKELLLFYKSAFELNNSDEIFDPKLLKANLIKLLMKRATSCNIVYLFGLLVLLRASEIRSRLCLSYQLLPLKAPLLRIKDGEIVELGSKTKTSETEYGIADFFIEVYLSDKKRWRPVDIEEFAVMEDPHELTPHLEQPVACLIGIDDGGCMMDLSPKYNADWLDKMKHLRGDAKFFNGVLARYAPTESEQAEEQQEVEQLHEQQGLPKIISQFKNHPKYALTRHLLKFEAFYPREPPVLGYVRNEPVHPRECVHTLRSKDTWHRLARQVKEGELPYSIVKARPKWNKQTESLMRDLPLEVYGEWQTEPYKPPVAENGIVPRNKFGNVELFHPDMLPIGTVHLKLPGLQRIAAELEVDCVPAVIGFDGVGRGCHPVLEGFVVCVENKELLEEAWNERQREDRNKRRERIRKRAVKNWKKLIRKIIWDLRLKRKYRNKLEQN